MTDQPTPETDAVFRLSRHLWSYTLKETCRRIERERDEARAALQRIADCDWVIQRLAGRDWVITLPERVDAVRKIAREALCGLNKETTK